mmetsp:Transcript_5713/g.18870  ORF Transcript_5713/g.18870 Transcript_5713/m.18870 type:complete len:250 (-) Transcript_5713:488-1237(-)
MELGTPVISFPSRAKTFKEVNPPISNGSSPVMSMSSSSIAMTLPFEGPSPSKVMPSHLSTGSSSCQSSRNSGHFLRQSFKTFSSLSRFSFAAAILGLLALASSSEALPAVLGLGGKSGSDSVSFESVSVSSVVAVSASASSSSSKPALAASSSSSSSASSSASSSSTTSSSSASASSTTSSSSSSSSSSTSSSTTAATGLRAPSANVTPLYPQFSLGPISQKLVYIRDGATSNSPIRDVIAPESAVLFS